MSGQQPSVGRIVLVPADPTTNNGADVAPAVITRVWGPDSVNVRVLLDGHETPWRTSVSRVDTLDNSKPHTWAWPPRV